MARLMPAIHEGIFVYVKIRKLMKIRISPTARPPITTPGTPMAFPSAQVAKEPSTTTPPMDMSVYPQAKRKQKPQAMKHG